MQRQACSLALLIGILVLSNTRVCYAEWVKDFNCPSGTVYRDLRQDAGRKEFCESLLPGSLRVNDGPFRSWYSEGHPGFQGHYRNGRQVGEWTECDRFDRCKHAVYQLSYPYEKRRPGFRPEIPVSYQHGKYVFDFASCWSTWVTQTGNEDLNLNIGLGSPYRCEIAYIPQHVLEHGGEGDYICRIPFSVGKRELDSLDLRHELVKLGLAQFCQTISRTGEALMLMEKHFMEVSTSVDVQCAAIEHDSAGREILTFRLNPYAADLVSEVAAEQGPLTTRICTQDDQPTEMWHDAGGHILFIYRLSDVPAKTKRQKKCIAAAIGLKSSCR